MSKIKRCFECFELVEVYPRPGEYVHQSNESVQWTFDSEITICCTLLSTDKVYEAEE